MAVTSVIPANAQAYSIISHSGMLGAQTQMRSPGAKRVESSDASVRVPTIAFTVQGRKASEIPPLLDARKLAIRWGNFYAVDAIDALGLAEVDGIVRVSMVHYNTLDEVDRLVRALDEVL